MSNLLLNTIPDELKICNQWVVWRYEPDADGKMTKIPYQVNGIKASTTDPKTWDTYENVIKASGFDGIGFVFDFPYAGIDLDHYRDPETGEISEYAKLVIAALNSYTEISPSGAGCHVLVQGTLKSSGNKNTELRIEMYDHARFFTVTGNHLYGTPLTIEKRQKELNEFHDKIFPKVETSKPGGNGAHPVNLEDHELIKKAMSAADGDKFRRLWEGDASGYNGDESARDQALMNLLAFWTGKDPARMDGLFRQSGCYREKWERKDYRDRTIKKAIESTRETYSAIPNTVP